MGWVPFVTLETDQFEQERHNLRYEYWHMVKEMDFEMDVICHCCHTYPKSKYKTKL